MRGKPRLTAATGVLYEAIRKDIPMLQDDRENGPDADHVAAILRDGALLARLRDGPGDSALFSLG